MDWNQIPTELRERPQWVLWSREQRGADTTKVLYNARNGRLARSTDPATWSSFKDAVDGLTAFPERDGLGFVFSDADPFVGVDLDGCVEEGGAVAEWAAEIVRILDSYTEFSQSRRGLHVILRGKLPPEDRRCGPVEMYETGRFFAITGDHVPGTPAVIEDRASEIRELHAIVFANRRRELPRNGAGPVAPIDLDDTALIEKARQTNVHFDRLWSGDASGYNSPSEADMALMNHLAFWCGRDEARMDRLFRASALMRPKWERDTYREPTIAKAVSSNGAVYDPKVYARREEPAPHPAASAPAPASGLTKQLADAIIAEDHFAQDVGQRLYVFKQGVYQPDGEEHVKRRVKALLTQWGEPWTSHRARETAEYIRTDAPELWDRPPADQINLKNGIYSLTLKRLGPHDPTFLSPVQIPVCFDSAAGCPHSEQFIRTTFPDDAFEVAWEIFALLMTTEPYEKAILLTGEGSNGKSTFLSMLIAFLGKRNVVNQSLQKLETERFAAARLLGKLANICPDLPSTHLADTSTFKAITGGDYISAEHKHRDGFDFVPFARLVFSANHPPQSSDASHAFFRRWIVVPFNRTFEPGDGQIIPRKELDARLSAAAELSGVLNKALAALPKVRQRTGITETPTMRAAWQDLRQVTDPLAVWWDREIEEDPTAVQIKQEVVQAYNRDCATRGRPPIANNGFWRAVVRLHPSLVLTQKSVEGKVREVALGVKLRRKPVEDDEDVHVDPRLSQA